MGKIQAALWWISLNGGLKPIKRLHWKNRDTLALQDQFSYSSILSFILVCSTILFHAGVLFTGMYEPLQCHQAFARLKLRLDDLFYKQLQLPLSNHAAGA